MSTKVLVTGLGVISSIGKNVEDTLKNIRQLKSGVGKIDLLVTRHKDTLLVGEIKQTDEELKEAAGAGNLKALTRPTILGMLAAREAAADAGLLENMEGTGFISANTVGGMGHTEQYCLDYLDVEKEGDFMEYIGTHNCGDSTERIADYLNIKEYVTTINTACSSSANAIMLGARLIKNGIVQRVIAGGTDSLTRFTLNGFNSLMILSKEQCKPFDENRMGLNLGEGAGFVVLESEEAAKQRGAKVYSELRGFANTCDAYHQTASSPEGYGASNAMNKALKSAGLTADDIDYVNLHGTATKMNDLSEGNAIETVFGDQVPDVSSTKGFTGHTLGAAGGIEAVFSNLSISENILFPNLNFTEQMEELNFSPLSDVKEGAEVNNVLSNSFGFGGNNSALLFSKV